MKAAIKTNPPANNSDPGPNVWRPGPIQGFTLIELLAAVAIMVVLAGLLFPALKMAQAQAARAKCISNLRQIGNAISLYSAENAGKMMPYATSNGDPVTPGIGKYYLELLGPMLPPPKDSSYLYSRIFSCPAQSLTRDPANTAQNRLTDYGLAGLNGILFGICSPTTGKSRFSAYWCDRAPSMGAIPQPSKVMMISDIGKNFAWSSSEMTDPGLQNWRHDGSINCVFVDGHAERRKIDSIPSDAQDVFWNGGNPDPVPR